MNNRDDRLLAEAYTQIHLKENLEQILPTLDFQQTTKKNLKYKPFEGAQDQMPPLSYTDEQDKGDVVMSGPSKEKYVVKADRFAKFYTKSADGTVTPDQSPRMVAQVRDEQQVTIKTPWGESQVLAPGDYIVKDGDKGYYRVSKARFGQTYNPLKD